jgi:hypothetical protein
MLQRYTNLRVATNWVRFSNRFSDRTTLWKPFYRSVTYDKLGSFFKSPFRPRYALEHVVAERDMPVFQLARRPCGGRHISIVLYTIYYSKCTPFVSNAFNPQQYSRGFNFAMGGTFLNLFAKLA